MQHGASICYLPEIHLSSLEVLAHEDYFGDDLEGDTVPACIGGRVTPQVVRPDLIPIASATKVKRSHTSRFIPSFLAALCNREKQEVQAVTNVSAACFPSSSRSLATAELNSG